MRRDGRFQLSKKRRSMKLVRFGDVGEEKSGIVDAEGAIRDLGGVFGDIAGANLKPKSLAELRKVNPKQLPLVGGRPGFWAVGWEMAFPGEPVVFMKATSAICGAYDDVMIPRGSEKTDWEVELGVVIGKEARYVTEAEALSLAAGRYY